MRTLSAGDIKGNWCTVLLPINQDETIDFSRLSAEIDAFISINPDGMYCNGTAGEFYNLTEDEFDQVGILLAEKCNSAGIPFQIGVSHMSPVISLERLKRSVDLKPGAVQVILPDWFFPTYQECVTFLNKMSESAGEIGIVLYNPPHAKKRLTPAELFQLTYDVPHLVGLKVADGDDSWYQEMTKVAEKISVFIPGHKIATGHKLKVSHGAYSNMACLNPKAAQLWADQILIDLEKALELESRINQFLSGFIAPLIAGEKYSNQAVDKMLAAIGGWADIGCRLRWPYRSLSTDLIGRLRPKAKEMIPEFFIEL